MRLPRFALLPAFWAATGCVGETFEAATTEVKGAREELICDGSFDLSPFDTGAQAGCTSQAPWGTDGWGVDAESFLGSSVPQMDGFRVATTELGQGYLHGFEDSGNMSFVRLVQGWAFSGGTPCEPRAADWAKFPRTVITGRNPRLSIDVYRDPVEFHSLFSSWVLIGFNVWFVPGAADLQPAAYDPAALKPIVMDLVVHHATNTWGAGLRSFESAIAYHYQRRIGTAPVHQMKHFEVDLEEHLVAALEHFDLDPGLAESYRLAQAEFVIEIKHASASAVVDNMSLTIDAE